MIDSFQKTSIATILNGYRSGQITPLDVAQWTIDAWAKHEPLVHAWECFDPDMLLAVAKSAYLEMRVGGVFRALEGIPIGVKDIFNTTDYPTQMGSPLWKGFTPGNDARALYNIRRSGALIAGKTVTAEFAVHALGKTLNPYAIDRTPGTSSSGSAVAVATGMVPVALGTQTAGSIIRPASFCGVWGFKPSFGLVPRTGMLKTTDSLDSVGYFVSHAGDLERVFNALRVHGRNFPISHSALTDVVRQSAPKARPWRVAFVRPHIWKNATPYATQLLEDWCVNFSKTPGFEICEPALPACMSEAHDVHATIYNRALAYYFKEEFNNAELISPIMNQLIAKGLQISTEQYEAALDRQIQLAHTMDNFFHDVDILITLSTAGHAPPREEEESPDSALMWTLAHLPAISAPVFRSPAGLPFGLQIVGRRYNDVLLFRFIEQLVGLGLLPASGMSLI